MRLECWSLASQLAGSSAPQCREITLSPGSRQVEMEKAIDRVGDRATCAFSNVIGPWDALDM